MGFDEILLAGFTYPREGPDQIDESVRPDKTAALADCLPPCARPGGGCALSLELSQESSWPEGMTPPGWTPPCCCP